MHSTIVAPNNSDGSGNIAISYLNRVVDGQHQINPWRAVDLSHRLPRGGFFATSSDLVRMGLAHLNNNYLSEQVRREFSTPQRLESGEVNEQNYALAWLYGEWPADGVGLARNINHGGVSRGAQSFLAVFPELDMVIAINANIKTASYAEFSMLDEDILQAFIE
ncbi:beta-lactamase family protein [Thalassotalea sp. Y01]|nr:beta-lactamase family protein [Thalassotalea sp. Y01]